MVKEGRKTLCAAGSACSHSDAMLDNVYAVFAFRLPLFLCSFSCITLSWLCVTYLALSLPAPMPPARRAAHTAAVAAAHAGVRLPYYCCLRVLPLYTLPHNLPTPPNAALCCLCCFLQYTAAFLFFSLRLCHLTAAAVLLLRAAQRSAFSSLRTSYACLSPYYTAMPVPQQHHCC